MRLLIREECSLLYLFRLARVKDLHMRILQARHSLQEQMHVSDNRCPCRVTWRVFLTVTHSAGLIERNIGKLITRVGGQCTTHDASVNLWKSRSFVLLQYYDLGR